MIKSYGVFAEFYDVLTANIDYKKRALYFDELITVNKAVCFWI